MIWVVTDVVAHDITSPTTEHRHYLRHDGNTFEFYNDLRAIGAAERTRWGGWKWLDEADTIRVYFIGGLAGDNCVVTVTGHIMTLET